jgi:uncharacterized membrane protein
MPRFVATALGPERRLARRVRVWEPRRVSDPQHREGGVRLFGHPAHAMLAAFPIGLLTISVVADLAALASGDPFFWRASFWAVAAGLVAAVPAAATGMIDLMDLEEDDPAVKTGSTHMGLMAAAVGLFVLDVVTRGGDAPPAGGRLYAALALDLVGSALGLVGAWYGGELVFGHGVGRRSVARAREDARDGG